MKRPVSPRVGAARPSQLMFSHGVGSLVDLPNFSAIVAGLDDWNATYQDTIVERRLLSAVRQMPMMTVVEALRTPPFLEETKNPFDEWARVGVPVFPFPRWMRCTGCNLLLPIDSGLLELKQEPYRPDRTRFVHNCRSDGKPPIAVPARFVTACPAGHMDEFPWVEFCHEKPCSGKPQLRLNEIGGSRSTDVQVECLECGQKRHLALAFGEPGRKRMPKCRGRHPHLRRFDQVDCEHQLQAVLLGASNSWFPVTKSALSLPVSDDEIEQLVEKHWGELASVASRQELDAAIKFSPTLKVLIGRNLDRIWAGVEARRHTPGVIIEAALDLLGPEWELFQAPDRVRPTDDFRLVETQVPEEFRPFVRRLVLVERVRVVTAMCGFTRIDGPDSGVADDEPDVKCAPLSRELPKWVPAAESRGEGIFVELDKEKVAEWEERVEGSPRMEALRLSHQRWREHRGLDPAIGWEGARYVLLHSLAHALATEFALECGYSAAAVQERIYSRLPGGDRPQMAGLLIYTAASDSEGTLGGLVSLGETHTFGRLLSQALERCRLCSADPLCAEHVPHRTEDVLHNAACHACLFVPETSCERGNRYLDRAVLVPTLSGDDIGYFR